MNERDVWERLAARYGSRRARHLFGTLRVLMLYGEEETLRWAWLSRNGLETLRRDLHLAGVPWPSPVGERGPMPPGER